MPFLVYIDGGQQRQIEITKPRFTIGKRQGNDLVLSDVKISREHAEIIATESGYALCDLDSRNGTFVDGTRVVGRTLLRDGADIHVASVPLRFHMTQPASGAQVPAAPRAATPASTAAQPAPASTDEEGQTPIELKQFIHKELLKDMDLKQHDFTKQTEEELYKRTSEVVRNIIKRVRNQMPPWLSEEKLLKEIIDEALGLGPLEDLLADEETDEVMVNDWDRIYVERHGKIERTKARFSGRDQVLAVIRRIIAPIGRRIDETTPMVDARLPDGSRVNAIIHPLSLSGPTITIRKFATDPFTVDDLIGFGSMNRTMADFLALAVKYRANILISGGPGSGKTTLLNVVSNFIPDDERIVTVEDAAELRLSQEHVISLESKPPNIQGEGAIPIRELVRNSLRMRPDRIVVGECRGAEALDMLQAMNTGHDGSLTTLHANTPRDALNRLETLVLMAGMELPSAAIRDQIVGAIDFIVQTSRMPDGTRKITYISEIIGERGEDMDVRHIFLFKQSGFDADGKVVGDYVPTGEVPDFIDALKQRSITVNMDWFKAADALEPPTASMLEGPAT